MQRNYRLLIIIGVIAVVIAAICIGNFYGSLIPTGKPVGLHSSPE